jgi:hypothetical protein
MRISRIFKESRDILGAYLGFLQNYSWQRWLFVFLAPLVLETAFLKLIHILHILCAKDSAKDSAKDLQICRIFLYILDR